MSGERNISDELRSRLESFEEISFALLFGSRARDDNRPDSDIDLAVYLDNSLTPAQRFDARLRLSAELVDLGEPDVVILNDAPPLLGHRALRGRLVLARDRVAHIRYFVRTLAAYHDERPFRLLHERARRLRAKEADFGRS